MQINPKHVVLVAISNYLNRENLAALKDDIGKASRISDDKFIRITEKYFDYRLLRDKPIIPEDIWLFNYLMYENKKKDNFNPADAGEKISIKGKLVKKGLILKYYKQIVLPQLNALQNAELILSKLY